VGYLGRCLTWRLKLDQNQRKGNDMHSKRNKGGHTFDQYPSGIPNYDPMGNFTFCKCGLKEYDWNCKWRWS